MKRSELRKHIFKMLFGLEFNAREELSQQLELYFDQLEEDAEEKEITYMRGKAEAVAEHLTEIDALLNAQVTGWKTSRMNKVDLTILRLALYEMKWDEDVPESVAIHEAVMLAKEFGGDESSAFVNGVLGKIVRQE